MFFKFRGNSNCGAGGDETCINIKLKKRTRKGHKLIGTLENNVGAEKLECPLNLGPTVCEVGTEADENSIDNGVPITRLVRLEQVDWRVIV
jgi:hypothetical protein